MHPTHPLAEISAALNRLHATIDECRVMLPRKTPKGEDVASRAVAKAFVEQKVLEACQDLQNAPTALLGVFNAVIAVEEYWHLVAAVVIVGDAAKKMRVHLTKAWVAKDPVAYFTNKPPHAFLDLRRSATGWAL